MPTRPDPRPPVLRALASAGAALLLSAACAAPESASEEDRDVARLVAEGRYEEAVVLAAEQHEADPGDALALSNYRRATAAWYLEQGRRAAFEGRDFEALEHFRDAREVAPEAHEVHVWIAKMRDNLAERFLTEALEAHIRDDLQGANDAYERVLEFRPDDRHAREGLSRVLLQLNYRQGVGDAYYDEGVRALSDYWLHEAKSRFGYVGKYLPENERSVERTEEVDELLAQARVAIARGLDLEGRFAAARNEYRLALTLDPDLPEALEGLERTRLEAEAAELLAQADMQIRRGNLAEARVLLEEGSALTERQQELFEGAFVDLEQAGYARLYARAISLESDRRFEEAVAAYDELLAEAEYYEDAIARRRTLQSFIEDAGRLYAAYEAAQDDRERAGLLRQIQVFWPDYRDVAERLAELEAASPPVDG